MDLPDNHDHLEAEHLNLPATHFPLDVTLRPRVVQQFADDPQNSPDAPGLGRDQLLDRLRRWSDLEDCPLDVVLAQGPACGEATTPSRDQVALLRWAGAAHNQWERDYPLESELAACLRRLKPLLAAHAVTDPVFLVPGKHPLHTLLDSVQAAAIGWQASLGRAARVLERQIEEVVEQALEWFEQPDTDLAVLASELEGKLARDGERSQKMARRVIEMEMGRQKKAQAAVVAARMINSALEKFEAPGDIGDMLKGPWYDSAQLVLLKFGAESEQWAQMSKATDTLLDSVQVFDTEPEDRRQHLFRVVTLLPKELRRWLLSLQHDTGAVDDAVGLVEFAHLCILRHSPLDVEVIPPLPLADMAGENREQTSETDNVKVGQWYLINREPGIRLRARVIFESEQERQLLFANRAGMEVLRLGCDEFAKLQDSGDAVQLKRGASYSRSLASAAGITSESDLAGLPDAAAETGSPATEEKSPEMISEAQEQARLWQEWEEARARQLERSQDADREAQTNDHG